MMAVTHAILDYTYHLASLAFLAYMKVWAIQYCTLELGLNINEDTHNTTETSGQETDVPLQ